MVTYTHVQCVKEGAALYAAVFQNRIKYVAIDFYVFKVSHRQHLQQIMERTLDRFTSEPRLIKSAGDSGHSRLLKRQLPARNENPDFAQRSLKSRKLEC